MPLIPSPPIVKCGQHWLAHSEASAGHDRLMTWSFNFVSIVKQDKNTHDSKHLLG